MKAKEAKLLKFLDGAKQFIIPIYQRTYSWQLKQCDQLFKDIVKINKDEDLPGHFIGSIVYFEENIHNQSEVPKLLVIDGQQRLTTVTLLIQALSSFLESNTDIIPETNTKKIRNYYLLNPNEDGELFYKLLLTRKDKETLKSLISRLPHPEKASPKIIENYEFFKEKINADNAHDIFKGLQKLFIVDVALERGKDNPQLIFESLNSTGLELSQADLIRNYVLMGQDPDVQKNLYEKYWYPMEQGFGNRYNELFDGFMRHYLTLKTYKIPRKDEVYEEFKRKTKGKVNKEEAESIVGDINTYANYYLKIALGKEENKKLNKAFHDLRVLKVDVAYPLLLEAYDDFSQDVIDADELEEVTRFIESYVFRRTICGIPTNSLNKTFANFMKDVDKENYLESFKAKLLLLTSYRKFPSDSEVEREMPTKDVYNFRSRNYLLSKLENHDHKESINVEEYTIEHILPQNENLSKEWVEMLGEDAKGVQEKYLHTIGNLTLTGYNSELSDKPFSDKKNMKGGFKDSRLRLNNLVATKENWNKEAIIERAKNLTQKTIGIWKSPYLPEEILDKYKKETQKSTEKVYTIDHYELDSELYDLYMHIKKRVLNIDASVYEEFKKRYIAFKSSSNFVDIIVQKKRLVLSLSIGIDEINDPQEICRDVSNVGRWGTGSIEVGFQALDQLDYIMDLIHQAFEKQ